mmetsp:Transcript_41950/g.105804  ORF Transcript_41950/g.105804 Transcript_41950/m.105804 type:complete len:248 (+) Transcript_41950:447-1190(+)
MGANQFVCTLHQPCSVRGDQTGTDHRGDDLLCSRRFPTGRTGRTHTSAHLPSLAVLHCGHLLYGWLRRHQSQHGSGAPCRDCAHRDHHHGVALSDLQAGRDLGRTPALHFEGRHTLSVRHPRREHYRLCGDRLSLGFLASKSSGPRRCRCGSQQEATSRRLSKTPSHHDRVPDLTVGGHEESHDHRCLPQDGLVRSRNHSGCGNSEIGRLGLLQMSSGLSVSRCLAAEFTQVCCSRLPNHSGGVGGA